ncbi:MAG: LysM peptidoglycan-binding domain-containing protein [Chthoniobacterales bacterium]|nr:LysM peptidoglycan-binding domain-containing protein [Chthoniobacterales bacterium]
MRIFKIALLFIVGFCLFGSVGFFAYQVFWKPYGKSLSCSFLCRKKSNAPTTSLPVADPSLRDFESAVALQQEGKLLEAQQAWQSWLQTYPNSAKKKEVLDALGKINMEQLSSPSSAADKEVYTVIKGDSLDRIARKKKSNAELIQKINGLSGINLQIGETLLIPQLQISMEIDRQEGLLLLRNKGAFFKSYSLLSIPPGGSSEKPLETVIVDRIAMNGNKRTAFGDKKYPESQQMILLRSAGNIVTATPKPPTTTAATSLSSTTAAASSEAMPPGFVLAPTDMREVFLFVSQGTPVMIR